MSEGFTSLPDIDLSTEVGAFYAHLIDGGKWSSAPDLRIEANRLDFQVALLQGLVRSGFRELPLPRILESARHGYKGLPPCFLRKEDLSEGKMLRAVWVLGGSDPATGADRDFVQTGFLRYIPDVQDVDGAVFIQDGRSYPFFAAGESLPDAFSNGPVLKAVFWKPNFRPDEDRLGNHEKTLSLALNALLSRLGFYQGGQDLWSKFISMAVLPSGSSSLSEGTYREDLENLEKVIDELVRFGALDERKSKIIKAKITQFFSTYTFPSIRTP